MGSFLPDHGLMVVLYIAKCPVMKIQACLKRPLWMKRLCNSKLFTKIKSIVLRKYRSSSINDSVMTTKPSPACCQENCMRLFFRFLLWTFLSLDHKCVTSISDLSVWHTLEFDYKLDFITEIPLRCLSQCQSLPSTCHTPLSSRPCCLLLCAKTKACVALAGVWMVHMS